MGKTVIETRTVNRSARETERKHLERTLVDMPAYSNAIRYALVFCFTFLIVGITLFVYSQYHTNDTLQIYNEVNFASYWLAVTAVMTMFVYKFFYHSTRYNLRHELFKLESRPQSEVVIETIEDDDDLPDALTFAESPTMVLNGVTIPKREQGKKLNGMTFTGAMMAALRRAYLHHPEDNLRRDPHPEDITLFNWQELRNEIDGDYKTHYAKAKKILESRGYITREGRWTESGVKEFLEIDIPYPDNDSPHFSSLPLDDDDDDGQNGGGE